MPIVRGFSTEGTGQKLVPFPGSAGSGQSVDTDDQEAGEVPFDNSGTDLSATDVQGAITELAVQIAACCAMSSGEGGGSTISAPTVVQQATDRSTSNGDTTLAPTFGANTTAGNYLVFIVTGHIDAEIQRGLASLAVANSAFGDRETVVTNQGIQILVHKVATPATTYNVTINNPNGGMTVLALELDSLSKVEYLALAPQISTSHVLAHLLCNPDAMNILAIENDNDTGAIVAQTSGLSTLYSGHGTVNHAAYFFDIADSLCGENIDIQFTTNPTAASSVGMIVSLQA